jgi:hypothetical protein
MKTNPNWRYSDGGRDKYFKGLTGDCVIRAISIVGGYNYKAVYDDLFNIQQELKIKNPSPRNGVSKKAYHKYLIDRGWSWTPTMFIGSGCKVHVRSWELPKGKHILRLSRHLTSLIDGIIHDTFDPSRNGSRCVYGYYTPPRVAYIEK